MHHPIATKSSEAQRFFDQGLTFVYAFNFPEAVVAFQHAAQLDPGAAMPHWGIALALGPNYNAWHLSPLREARAYDAIQTALARSWTAPAVERAYIEALSKRYSADEDVDQDRLGRAYAGAMRELGMHYPDDLDAATLYAESLMDLHPWKLWSADGRPSEDTGEIVSVLERVLQQWPDHIGANHYYIHALEAAPFPERALSSAKRLETLAPDAGHLLHMPAHAYFRTGDYIAAVNSALNAAVIDRQHLRVHPENRATYMGYASHNLLFLAASANMDGEFEIAWKAAKQLESDAYADAFVAAPIQTLLRFARWNEIVSLPAPDYDRLGVRFLWTYARGCAFAAKKLLRRAEQERAAMEDLYRPLRPGRAFGMFFNDWRTLHSLAVETLDARIAAAQGDVAGATVHWRAAVVVQDQMVFDDLPDWYYPVRESLGAALLRNGQSAEAENVFREDLERTRRNPRSLFGLWKALEAQQKKDDAAWVRRSVQTLWKGPELRIDDL